MIIKLIRAAYMWHILNPSCVLNCLYNLFDIYMYNLFDCENNNNKDKLNIYQFK